MTTRTNRSKHYAAADLYERKLARVMERLGVTSYTWDWGRWSAWVRFDYEGQPFLLEHSVEKSRRHGGNLLYGSDCFAQIVLTLEDLARAVERGLYKLSAFLGDELRALPPAPEIPECLRILGFDRIPTGVEEVRARYRELAKEVHPDAGGTAEAFQRLKEAADEAIRFLEERGRA